MGECLGSPRPGWEEKPLCEADSSEALTGRRTPAPFLVAALGETAQALVCKNEKVHLEIKFCFFKKNIYTWLLDIFEEQ